MKKDNKTVVIIGASDKKDRYSYIALSLLIKNGYTVFPVNPSLDSIEETKVYHSLSEIDTKVDTVTLYVNPSVSSKMSKEILQLNPRRIIFNPGSENSELDTEAQKAGISSIHACTIVLINTGQF